MDDRRQSTRMAIPPSTTVRSVSSSRGQSDTSWERAVELGDVHLAAENVPAALEYFERARGILAGSSHVPLTDQPESRVAVELRIAECMRRRGQQAEATLALEQLLAAFGDSVSTTTKARILARLGVLESHLARYSTARVHCEAAYEVFRGTNENEEIGMLELALGVIAFRLGQHSRASDLYESALFTFRRIDQREGIAKALNLLGLILSKGSRWREGREYLMRGLSVSEESGHYAFVASHCVNLGILHSKTGEWGLAQQRLSQALSIFREMGNPLGQTCALIALGNLKLRTQQGRVASMHYKEALEFARSNGYLREWALALEFLGEQAIQQGELSRAQQLLVEASEIGQRCAPEGDIVAEVRRRQADLCLVRGQASRAAALAVEAAQFCFQVREFAECGAALRTLALAMGELGRIDEAIAVARRAVDLLGETPDIMQLLLTRRALASLLADRAKLTAASPESRRDATEATGLLEELALRYQEAELPESAVNTLGILARHRAACAELDEAFAAVAQATALAEANALTSWLPKLEVMRANLEDLFAEDAVTRTAEFQLLQELAGLSPTDLNASTLACLQMAVRRSRSDRAILAWSEPGRRIRIESTVGFTAAESHEEALLEIARSFRNGRKLCVMQGPGGSASQLPASGAVSAVALPIQVADTVVGVLYLDRLKDANAGPYRNADLRMLSLFSGLLSVYLSAREHERRRPSGKLAALDADEDPYREFITCSAELKRSLQLLRKLEDSTVSILVSGETGTGKGLLARMIHDASTRSAGRFVPINCAALPETLLESELFGHVQGAFTGAVRTKRGLFEEAEGGSIFLDEVDKAPLGVQAKLLHVLDRHEVRPVGGTKWTSVDVRVVCATNVDLRRAISEGRFLEDLYYRLNDFQVHIPPLRERREDIPLLVRRFYQQFSREMGRNPLGLSREVIQVLTDHEWRGNVRELEKAVKRMLVLAEEGEVVGVDLLPRDIVDRASAPTTTRPRGTLRAEIQRLEARMIRDGLEATRGNKSEVARQLHLSYPSLLSKIKLYRIGPPAKSPSR